MIRSAKPEDRDRLVEMGIQFANEYAALADPSSEKIAATVDNLLTNPEAAIFVSGSDEKLTGMIALLRFEHPFSGGPTVSEVAWWVEPEARGRDGVRLLRAAEKWATDSGVGHIQMVAPNDRVANFYSRMGYVPVEVSYLRRF